MNRVNTQAGAVALITGAARRIGAQIARYLHHAGFDVVIHCYQSQRPAMHLAEELNLIRPSSAIVLRANLAVEAQGRSLIQQVIRWKGRFDLLVNNASLFIKDTNDTAVFDELFTVNVKAPFWLCDAAFDALKIGEGCVINITDIHAEKPLKDYSFYCQTKAALKMQTESLARVYAPFVRVNAVAPGAILWPEKDNALNEALKLNIISQTPLKRHGDPKWIAQAVYLLADNQFITGQTLRVDGGRSLFTT